MELVENISFWSNLHSRWALLTNDQSGETMTSHRTAFTPPSLTRWALSVFLFIRIIKYTGHIIISMYSWLEVIFATWMKLIFNSSEVVFSHLCKIPVFYCEKYRYSSHLWKIPVFSFVKVIFLLWRCKIPVFSFAKVVFLLWRYKIPVFSFAKVVFLLWKCKIPVFFKFQKYKNLPLPEVKFDYRD